ncbi:MAG: MBL fold metallo-hydrolase, partial [Pseudomonadota bacterium]
MDRRDFIAKGLGAAGALLAPHLASAQIGTARLTTVSDGALRLPGDFVFGALDQDALAPILASRGVDRAQVAPECNLALVEDGERRILFDVGAGPDFMPSAGRLTDSLAGLGLTPEDITHVVFTHAHPDHIWGLLDDFDEPLFPDATYLMGRAEWEYWWDPGTVDTIGGDRAAFAVGARRRMEVIEDRTIRFDPGAEILPGLAAVEAGGHTPGHMAFELRQGTEAALILGDAIANHHVALARPDWIAGSDQDGARGAATRLRLLDRIMAE